MSRTTSSIIVAVVIIIIVVAGILAYEFTMPGGISGGGGTKINLYASDAPYGFGLTQESVTSPGPPLNLTVGQTYTVTLHNVGTMPHNWAIVKEKTDGNTNLAFSGAQIESASAAVLPGSTGSVTFTAANAGNYYYICQLDGHVSLGMYGNLTISP